MDMLKISLAGLLLSWLVYVHAYWFMHPEMTEMQMFRWMIGLS